MWSQCLKHLDISDGIEYELDELELTGSLDAIDRHDIECFASLWVFLLVFLVFHVNHIHVNRVLIDVQLGHIGDFDVDLLDIIKMQTVEVNLDEIFVKVGLLEDASEVQCVSVNLYDVAHVELAIEGYVDAVRGKGGVEVDAELGVFPRTQLEVFLVEA